MFDFDKQLNPVEIVGSNFSYVFFSKSNGLNDDLVECYQNKTGEVKDISVQFSDYYLSDDGKVIYYVYENELSKGVFSDGVVSESISLASQTDYVKLSKSGDAIVFTNSNNTSYLLNDKYTKEIDSDLQFVEISDNENYLVYKKADDKVYVLKIGAREDVLIDEDVSQIYLIDRYVYSVSNGHLNYYKMGKYSSNKTISPIKKIGSFD